LTFSKSLDLRHSSRKKRLFGVKDEISTFRGVVFLDPVIANGIAKTFIVPSHFAVHTVRQVG
jgi:hypothetical protein